MNDTVKDIITVAALPTLLASYAVLPVAFGSEAILTNTCLVKYKDKYQRDYAHIDYFVNTSCGMIYIPGKGINGESQIDVFNKIAPGNQYEITYDINSNSRHGSTMKSLTLVDSMQ